MNIHIYILLPITIHTTVNTIYLLYVNKNLVLKVETFFVSLQIDELMKICEMTAKRTNLSKIL